MGRWFNEDYRKIFGWLLLGLSAALIVEAPFLVFQCLGIRATFEDSGEVLTPFGCFYYFYSNDGRAVGWVLAFVTIGVVGMLSGRRVLCGPAPFKRLPQTEGPRPVRAMDWVVVGLFVSAVIFPILLGAAASPDTRQWIRTAGNTLAAVGCAVTLAWMWSADGAHSRLWDWLPPFSI